ncbi:MAG: hypothetical protein ACOX8U_01845, partial [Bradymonadia bacterium]
AAFAYAMRASGEGACKRYFLVFVLTIKTVSPRGHPATPRPVFGETGLCGHLRGNALQIYQSFPRLAAQY